MYSEDRYNHAFNDDINDLDELNRLKEEQKALKAIDKYFIKEAKLIKTTKTNKKGEEITYNKTKYIDLYGSKGVGHKIRNATNGFYTDDIVGSTDEDRYFIVNDSRSLTGNQEPLFLYFDSPEQYENHCLVKVPQAVKEKWQKKFMLANN